jgi:thiol:disulfide interchange protein
LGGDGPISASFNVNKLEGAELVGKLQPRGREIAKFDPLFEMKLRYFEGSVTFVQKVKFTQPNYHIDAYLEYGACNDQNCMPPSEAGFKQSGKSPAVDAPAAGAKDALNAKAIDPALAAKMKADSLAKAAALAQTDSATQPVDSAALASAMENLNVKDLWKPVVKELQAFGGANDIANHSLFYIFFIGFVGGLLALVMPCIWPIIPMTVSFFLKRAKNDKKKGIRDAITYGLSIVVIYLVLGLAVTAIAGPSTLNALSTSAVFNIILFLLLAVFAFSFFGWFEIKLPDSWGNAVDNKASSTTGMISIFLMAFTLVLVSFSCTAPIIGLRDQTFDSNGVYIASSADYTNWKATNRFTLGVGFNYQNLAIDVAYQYSSQKGDFYPFESFTDMGCSVNATKVDNKRHQLLMTVGYRF